MKKLVLYVVNAIPAVVISYRPGMFIDYLPVGEAYYQRSYHRLTSASLGRLLRLHRNLHHHLHYVTDQKTGTEITILEITSKKGA